MGNVEFKSVSTNWDAPTFSEWTFGRLTNFVADNGTNSIQLQNFRFGQRVPIKSAGFNSEGKPLPMLNYESIGLTVQKLNLPENIPTIVGSLSTPNPDELMFLVMTVKKTE